MNRRAFVTSAVSSLPFLALASSPAAEPVTKAGRGFVVPAGRAREDETFRLFDRSYIDFKIKTADTGGNFFMIEQRELKRFGPPRHVHPNQDEWFRPLAGTFRIEVGSDKFEIGPGDLLFAPRGIPHVWAHVEDEPGGMMVAFSPAGKMEDFFHAFTKLPSMPPAPQMQGLFRAHEMEIVGPPLSL